MSEDRLADKWQLILFIQLAIMFLLLSIFSISLRVLSVSQHVNQSQNTNEPMQPINVKPEKVDYKQIDSIIEKKVKPLPLPINGVNGADGLPGASIIGPPGPAGTTVVGPKGESGAKGEDGQAGQDAIGEPGREVEMRSNPLNGDIEWRYVGDDSWQLLMKKCELSGTCT